MAHTVTRPPDIVLFLTDQQRFDQLGYASDGHFETPNLDRIARSGVIFENAYSASTVCVPSRVALLTGIEPHRVPTQDNGMALREGFWTVAHALKRAGYETALIGKAHFAPIHAQHGFDTMRLCEHLQPQGLGELSRERGDEVDDYHRWLLANGYSDWRIDNMVRKIRQKAERTVALAEVDVHTFPHSADVHPTGWVERETMAFLEARDTGRPLFLVVSFPHPHAPYNPPEPYASMFDPRDSQLPVDRYEVNEGLPLAFQLAFTGAPTRAAAADEQLVRRLLATVRGLVKHIDDAIGRVVARLDLTSTLVAFTSDHGDYAGHRGILAKTPWLPFEDLVRVPLFYAGFGVRGGRVVPSLVQNYDFALTALDYAGVDPVAVDFDSRSLRPLLAGAAEPDPGRPVYCCTGTPWPALRHTKFKYCVNTKQQQAVLFDLEQDPVERVNLAENPAYAGVMRDMSERLEQRLAKAPLEGATSAAVDASGESSPGAWIRNAGFFREVVGYADAVSLLSDTRMHTQFLEMFESLGASGPARELVAASLLSMNGDDHRRLRSLISGPFTPRAVDAVRPVAREAAHQLITAFESTGQCEFVTEFAVPYVQRTTAHHVGFPEEDVAVYWDAVELVASGKTVEQFVEGVLELVEYAKPILHERSRHPRDDVLTLLADRVDHGSLPEPVALVLVASLLSAGHNPPINQLGITVSLLSRRPEIWDAIATGELAPARVVEAVLRFRSTNQGVLRRVSESFDHRGVRFNEGETIIVNTGAANHDARRFAAPDRLDPDADSSSHLAFGFGPHFCLGAALARVQLQEALSALAQRLTCPEVVAVSEMDGPGLVGPSSLVVSFSRRHQNATRR
jgi:arylsulfatase A-like enzyme/cytochrome P450